MKRSAIGFPLLVAMSGCVAIACSGTATENAGGNAPPEGAGASPPAAAAPHAFVPACGEREGLARCNSWVGVDENGRHLTTTAPTGLSPSQLRQAYAVAGTGGADKTIGIVVAYDNPNAENDLAVYRSQYGMSACTTANGCFRKLNSEGLAGPYTAAPPGSNWPLETSLDLDMASALCPSCKLLVIEADTETIAALGKAVNTAVCMGASVVNNSYSFYEDSSAPTNDAAYFHHPGVFITASSGDTGYAGGVRYPASSQWVAAVGGTTLVHDPETMRLWSETAWVGSGSGCSQYVGKPSWQNDATCAKRMEVDVSAVADPNQSAIAIYDGGWKLAGGTSAASAIVAATFASLNAATADGPYIWQHSSYFNDVTSGSTGSCGGSYYCTAKPGYDGPTGIGTPIGSMFTASYPVPYQVGAQFRQEAAGDFTGDHYADIAEEALGTGWMVVDVNQHNGTFPRAARTGAAPVVQAGAGWETLIGDFTGDGWADYADHSLTSGWFWVHANHHDGTFTPQNMNDGSAQTAYGSTWETWVGDFNGDGYADFADHSLTAGSFYIHVNNHNGTFATSNWGTGVSTVGSDWETLIADFTGDGYADYADHQISTGNFWIHANQHNGTFASANWGTGTSGVGYDYQTVVGDFTGDGYADYMDVHRVSGDFTIHANQHNGTFASGSSGSGTAACRVLLGFGG